MNGFRCGHGVCLVVFVNGIRTTTVFYWIQSASVKRRCPFSWEPDCVGDCWQLNESFDWHSEGILLNVTSWATVCWLLSPRQLFTWSIRYCIWLLFSSYILPQLNRCFQHCSAPFFIPSTSFCSLSSWFTSSYAYHLITVITFVLTTYHSLGLSLQT